MWDFNETWRYELLLLENNVEFIISHLCMNYGS